MFPLGLACREASEKIAARSVFIEKSRPQIKAYVCMVLTQLIGRLGTFVPTHYIVLWQVEAAAAGGGRSSSKRTGAR